MAGNFLENSFLAAWFFTITAGLYLIITLPNYELPSFLRVSLLPPPFGFFAILLGYGVLLSLGGVLIFFVSCFFRKY